MDAIGRIIPIYEDNISEFNKRFQGIINYAIINPQPRGQSMYIKFLNEWIAFYENLNGIKPKFTGVDGNALKQIIKYLQGQSESDQEALVTWQSILYLEFRF